MERSYSPLDAQRMRAGAVVRQPELDVRPAVTFDDPALTVMTDLARVPAVLVDPDVDIEAAMRIMIRRNVRSLFVVNVDSEILGLITATDLLGEKPVQHLQRYGGRRTDIRVRDLMTPRAQLEVLPLTVVERACIGHVAATLARDGRQHAMVVADAPGDRQLVCGVFSASQIEKQVGRPVGAGSPARSFAEIKQALAHT